MTAVRASRRRPRFRDRVLLDKQTYEVVAAVVAPARGFWVRPLGAADAAGDRLLTVGDWSVMQWRSDRQRWEAA